MREELTDSVVVTEVERLGLENAHLKYQLVEEKTMNSLRKAQMERDAFFSGLFKKYLPSDANLDDYTFDLQNGEIKLRSNDSKENID